MPVLVLTCVKCFLHTSHKKKCDANAFSALTMIWAVTSP